MSDAALGLAVVKLRSDKTSCCSSVHLLKRDERPLGKCWYDSTGGGATFRVLGHGTFKVIRPGLWERRLLLTSADESKILASADPVGLTGPDSAMQLSVGQVELRGKGTFSSGCEAVQGDRVLAHFEGVATANAGWSASATESLSVVDLLFFAIVCRALRDGGAPVVS